MKFIQDTGMRSTPFYAAWSLAPLWMLIGAAAVAGAWLQPNHYHPWTSFNSDAWIALAGLVAAGFLFVAPGARVDPGLHGTVLGCLAVVLVLALQRATGLVTSDGLVFINTVYVLGLALAMLAGARCQLRSDLRDRVLDTFFLAVGLAAFVSVVIQLYQWLQLPAHFFWVMEGGNDRPYANLGQPNQLATLLLWGALAVMWGAVRGKLGPVALCAAVAVLAAGLALTRSRTGMVEIVVLLAGLWAWRRLWPRPWIMGVMAVVAVLTYVFILSLQPVVTQLMETGAFDGQGGARSVFDAESSSARMAAYKLYWAAVVERPWFGYGWGQLSLAQLAMSERFPATHVLYTHSHNLFLDVAVGMGLPLACVFTLGVCWWVIRSARAVAQAEEAVLVLMVLVLGVHAMLELPLHYGYFLWPAGFVVGVLNVRLRHWACVLINGLKACVALWLVCAAAWALVVRDYLLAEEEYRITRFEALNIGRTPPGPRPEMWVLSQLGDLIWLARMRPVTNMPAEDLDRMRRVVSMYPALAGITRLAESLALNGHPDEAAMWLRRLQKVASPLHIRAGELHWMARSASEPAVAQVVWPR